MPKMFLRLPTLIMVAFALGLVLPVWPSYPQEQTSSPYITEYNVPGEEPRPLAITVDPSGNVWFTSVGAKGIGLYEPSTGRFTWHTVPTDLPTLELSGIAVDGQGRVWFTDSRGHAIWRLDPSTTPPTFKKIPTPTEESVPYQLHLDSRGFLWFTELRAGQIGYLDASKPDPSTSDISEFKIPTRDPSPGWIATDRDGRVWFTEIVANKIGFFDPENKSFGEFELPIKNPLGMALDPSGNIWFAQHNFKIAKFDPTNNELVEYATSDFSGPYGLAIDHKGNMWFAEHFVNRIALFMPSKVELIEYAIPTAASDTLSLALDGEGRAWFAEFTGGKLGFVDPSIQIPFETKVSQGSFETFQGSSATLEVSVQRALPTSSSLKVDLKARSTVADVSASFEPSSVELGPEVKASSSRLEVKTASSIEPGEYLLTVTGSDGLISHSTMVRMVVKPAPINPYLIILLTIALGAVGYFIYRKRRALVERKAWLKRKAWAGRGVPLAPLRGHSSLPLRRPPCEAHRSGMRGLDLVQPPDRGILWGL